MIRRIEPGQLRLGMFVHDVWMEPSMGRTAFLLDSAQDLARIQAAQVLELWIDPSKGLDVAGPSPVHTALAAEADPQRVAAVREALALRDKGLERVQGLFSEARMGKVLQVEGCVQTVKSIISSVDQSQGTLISLLRLKSQDEYTYLHSVAVCALMVALGRTLGMPDPVLHEVGVAGLLHDIGKARIPPDILMKPGKLTEAEYMLVRDHPAAGHAMLLKHGGVSKVALEVCLAHHEKVDGTGYPSRLKDKRLGVFARMAALCDVYDAVTSARPYKGPWDPADAVRQMAQWKGHFDPALLQAFIKTVGIYPTGSLVKLRSERVGVVQEQSRANLLTPRVRVLVDARTGEAVEHTTVDLAEPGCDDAIVGAEKAEKWGLATMELAPMLA